MFYPNYCSVQHWVFYSPAQLVFHHVDYVAQQATTYQVTYLWSYRTT